MPSIVVADIGGTHARFGLANFADGSVSLEGVVTLRTADYPDLPAAWRAFSEEIGKGLPKAAAIAVAAPLLDGSITFTNSTWTIVKGEIRTQLDLDQLILINDFVAVGHAVATLDSSYFRHLCGPERGIEDDEIISVLGPGTGLGVAHVVRHAAHSEVIAGEGGHMAFAPLDEIEDRILQVLRARYRRVSVERVLSGAGLAAIHDVLRELDGAPPVSWDDAELWRRALAGLEPLAVAALDRYCACLGSVAGDLVLAQGGTAVVIAGGLGLRIGDRLLQSPFATRFIDKGRFCEMMKHIPVKLITHHQPGLYGAAIAFSATQKTSRDK